MRINFVCNQEIADLLYLGGLTESNNPNLKFIDSFINVKCDEVKRVFENKADNTTIIINDLGFAKTLRIKSNKVNLFFDGYKTIKFKIKDELHESRTIVIECENKKDKYGNLNNFTNIYSFKPNENRILPKIELISYSETVYNKAGIFKQEYAHIIENNVDKTISPLSFENRPLSTKNYNIMLNESFSEILRTLGLNMEENTIIRNVYNRIICPYIIMKQSEAFNKSDINSVKDEIILINNEKNSRKRK